MMGTISENIQGLIDTAVRFLEQDQWSYQFIEDRGLVRAGYRGEHGTWVCYLRINPGASSLSFYSSMGMNIVGKDRPFVLQYLNLINAFLESHALGLRFEMDENNGDVHLRSSDLQMDEAEVDVTQVRRLAYQNVRAMDHYFPGVIAMVHAGLLPEEALAQVGNFLPIHHPGHKEYM